MVTDPALKAAAARDRPVEQHRVTRFDVCYTRAHFHNDAGSFMPHDQGLAPGHGVVVCVTDAGCPDVDQHLLVGRAGHVDLGQLKGSITTSYDCTGYHLVYPRL